MIPALSLVALVGVVLVLGALDRYGERYFRFGDRVHLYAVGWWINLQVWAWPNTLRTARYRPRHRGGSSLAQILDDLQYARELATERAAARLQVRWVGVT